MTLESFDISREEIAVIPFIKAAGKLSSGLKIIASPWSPPPYMKDNGQWQGGYLKSECYKLWAEYIRRYIDEMKKYQGKLEKTSSQSFRKKSKKPIDNKKTI